MDFFLSPPGISVLVLGGLVVMLGVQLNRVEKQIEALWEILRDIQERITK